MSELWIDIPTSEHVVKEEDFVGERSHVDENGRFHSENDEPARVFTSGMKMWYNHGKIHREDGPAIIYPSGAKFYYKDGKRHRTNGPASLDFGYVGMREYWIEGEYVTDDPLIWFSMGYSNDER